MFGAQMDWEKSISKNDLNICVSRKYLRQIQDATGADIANSEIATTSIVRERFLLLCFPRGLC